jgi:hypothetical protein
MKLHLDPPNGSDKLTLVEVGSGVGNAIFPLLEMNDRLQVFAFDFARSAIEIMQSSEVYMRLNEDERDRYTRTNTSASDSAEQFRVLGRVLDVVQSEFPLEDNSIDLALCMFVLSAIAPEVSILYYLCSPL